MFTLSFIPFLMLSSVVLGKDLSRALVTRSEFNAEASRDVTMLFTHGRTALTSLSIIGIALVIFGAESVSRILQTWYAKIFRTEIRGWKALARRAEWLAGVFAFVALQFVIGRIGAMMTLLTIEVGLGVALHLGAVIGATIRREATDDPGVDGLGWTSAR